MKVHRNEKTETFTSHIFNKDVTRSSTWNAVLKGFLRDLKNCHGASMKHILQVPSRESWLNRVTCRGRGYMAGSSTVLRSLRRWPRNHWSTVQVKNRLTFYVIYTWRKRQPLLSATLSFHSFTILHQLLSFQKLNEIHNQILFLSMDIACTRTSPKS